MTEMQSDVDAAAAGMRVDRYLSDVLGVCSRSQIKQRVTDLTVNGAEAKLSKIIHEGDRVLARVTEPVRASVEPEEALLDILYEDQNVVVINKRAGMVVHPGAGNLHGTLMQALLFHVDSLRSAYDGTLLADRPGIVHRLDKDTSGVIIAAKNPEAHEFLAIQFRRREAKKVYLAVLNGKPPRHTGVVEGNLKRDPGHRKRFTLSEGKGKMSRTRYFVIRSSDRYTLVRLFPETGRTHQLRVHMRHIGCPILGDPIYSRSAGMDARTGLKLHAFKLTITTPDGQLRTFVAPLPDSFSSFVARELPAPAHQRGRQDEQQFTD